MEKNVEVFVKEFTDNFSELFVESFFIRYMSNGSEKDLLIAIKEAKKLLNQKLNRFFSGKLSYMGFQDEEIEDCLK